MEKKFQYVFCAVENTCMLMLLLNIVMSERKNCLKVTFIDAIFFIGLKNMFYLHVSNNHAQITKCVII